MNRMTRSASPDPARRRPASTDVARLAGVSQKTVSRVMNAESHVSDDVRARVMRAAAQLGYRRNGAARALNSGRAHRIGVVSLGTALFGPASMLIATERAARRHGYGLSVVYTAEDDPAGISGAVETLIEQGIDGLVLSEPIDEGPITVDVDMPVLTLGRYPGLGAKQLIHISDVSERAGYLATRHLLDRGHTEIRHVSGPHQWWAARDREAGWRSAMRDAGLTPAEPVEGDWLPASGYKAGLLLADDLAMTAVFVSNDDMAIGLIRGLHESGRRVPDDVSVIGVDDIPLASYCLPRLSTVAQSFDSVVEDGLRRLINAIESPATDQSFGSREEPPIIERESVLTLRRSSRRRSRAARS
jgi:DNA-binding LacI/PurR family transcriptional regulator